MKKLLKNTLESKIILDASKSNWVDKLCPLWSKPFLKLSRLDRPIGTWLLLLPCWWGSSLAILSKNSLPTASDAWIIFSCIFGATLMRGAGCTWNDISDHKFDAQVSRTKLRPIPSEQVSIKQALAWMFFQALLSLLILLTFNELAILVGLLSIIPIIIYPFAKRFTWWPQVFLGICFNWGIILSFVAHNNSIELTTMLLYLAAVFWTLFYDTIYAFQDTEDDALIGLKSTALLFGKYAKNWLASFILIILILMQTSFYMVQNLTVLSKIILASGVISFVFHLVWQLWKFDSKDSELCLKLFKSNKIAGLLVVFFAILSIGLVHL
jgi:4-hydroxybenzoate polyprenyltransferase